MCASRKIMRNAAKQKRLVVGCLSAVILAFTAFLVCLQGRQSPHQDLLAKLDVSDVEYISVYASGEDREARLSDEDAAEIVRQLSTVHLIGVGTQDYADHFSLRHPMFHVRLTDGLEFDFAAWKPYYVINTETFGERFGYSMGDVPVTGSGYLILNTWNYYSAWRYHDNDVCNHLRKTYDNLCRKYFLR